MASEAFWTDIPNSTRQAITSLISSQELEEQLPPMVHVQPVKQKQALLTSILDAFAQAHAESSDGLHVRALRTLRDVQMDMGRFEAAEVTQGRIEGRGDANGNGEVAGKA